MPLAGAPPRLTKPARRVVSQTVFTDELLLEIAAPEQIASLSHLSRDPQFCARPALARKYPALPLNTDAEAILRHRPDLVLFTDFSRSDLCSQVRRAGVPILSFSHYSSLDDALASLGVLAAHLGADAEARAAATVDRVRTRVARLARLLRKATPVRVISPSTFDILPGADTNFQDYCDHACAENLAKTVGGLAGNVPVPGEKILRWPVEKVVLVGGEAADGDSPLPTPAQIGHALQPFRRKSPYRHLRAVREGAAALLPTWQSSCVSHHRLACYEYLARQLHPACFAHAASLTPTLA
ncbi:MAG: ABC transporter substrate-binding protein [Puniceicoccales bacterium]|nr:ABC transporter substrate-binding protein [Puniceicoccales bacterium]